MTRRPHDAGGLRLLSDVPHYQWGQAASSLGVHAGKLHIPYDAFAAEIGDDRIVTTLCPGGKERIPRLMDGVRTKQQVLCRPFLPCSEVRHT
jgi:hypothetical protein